MSEKKKGQKKKVDKSEEEIEMRVASILIDPFTKSPVVVLKDREDKNTVPIWIGIIEASSIAARMEGITISRPLTHDLIKNILDTFALRLKKIVICDLKDNTYYATLNIEYDGKEIEIDSRPSDAIAISLRTDSPIYVKRKVIEASRSNSLADREKDITETDKEQWSKILEELDPEDFGKYKM